MSKAEAHGEAHGFRRFLAVRKIGDGGLVHKVDAAPAELQQIAAFLDVVAVKALHAEFRISRWRSRGLKLEGQLKAEVEQACVVTLEPVTTLIDAPFERRFLPEEMLDPTGEGSDIFVDPEGEDPPEPLPHELDLGEIMVEELALNIDPYPRKEGTVFEAGSDPSADAPPPSPFAALARLKGRLGPKQT